MTDFQLLSTLLVFSWVFLVWVIFYFNKRIGAVEVTSEIDRHALTKRIIDLEQICRMHVLPKTGPIQFKDIC